MRDGGIDAVAALDDALREALVDLPAEKAEAIKHAFGRAMSAVLDETVNPAVRAFPELEPDDDTWRQVVKARAAARAGS